MKELSLNVEPRTETGKNECNRLRSSGYIPAVLYSPGSSENIKVFKKDFTGLFRGHISESVLISLTIAGSTEQEKTRVFVKDYMVDPLTDELLHVDLYKITAGHKIKTVVPVEIKGTPIGLRTGGILEIMERTLEIECLPAALPEKIEIDVSELQVGQSIHIRDLKVAEGVKFLSPSDRVIAAVLIPHVVKEEVEPTAVVEGEAAAAEAGEAEAGKDKEPAEKEGGKKEASKAEKKK